MQFQLHKSASLLSLYHMDTCLAPTNIHTLVLSLQKYGDSIMCRIANEFGTIMISHPFHFFYFPVPQDSQLLTAQQSTIIRVIRLSVRLTLDWSFLLTVILFSLQIQREILSMYFILLVTEHKHSVSSVNPAV